MPATPNNSGNMSRRQSFNGKGLTFIELGPVESIPIFVKTDPSGIINS